MSTSDRCRIFERALDRLSPMLWSAIPQFCQSLRIGHTPETINSHWAWWQRCSRRWLTLVRCLDLKIGFLRLKER